LTVSTLFIVDCYTFRFNEHETAMSATFFQRLYSDASDTTTIMHAVHLSRVCRFLCRARHAGEHLHNNPRPDHLQNTYQRYVAGVMRRRRHDDEGQVARRGWPASNGDHHASTALVYHSTASTKIATRRCRPLTSRPAAAVSYIWAAKLYDTVTSG